MGVQKARLASLIAIRFVASGASFGPVPAVAQSDQQRKWCNEKDGAPDQRISGCTAVIQSGSLADRSLAPAFNNRGIAYADKGQHDRAIQDFDQAIRLDPGSASLFNNRGRAYSAKGQYDRAIPDFDQAIRLDPTKADAFHDRGRAYGEKGQSGAAPLVLF